MSSSPNQFKRVFLPTLLLFVVAAFVTRLVVDREFRGLFNPEFWHQSWRISRVMELAHQEYLHDDKVTYNQLADMALDHILDGLDRYTEYMSPADFADLTREGDQRFVGVGVEIERYHGRIQLARVFPDSPAGQAGWKMGDRILAVGNIDVSNYYISGVSDLLKGDAGTDVHVTLERPGSPTPIVTTLTRGGFDIPSIRDVELRPDGIGYMRLTQFGKRSGQEFSQAVSDLMGKGMRGLVLDLRDNPGGLLDSTVDLLEPLLTPGQLIVSTRGRDGDDELYLPKPSDNPVHYSGPMVVLVNDNSASAAEIVAGALQDTKRAVILGQRTYGKGIVQKLVPMPDGSGVRLTTEAYFLPSGRTIQDKGVNPDVPMTMSDETWDLLHFQRAELHHITPAEFAAEYGFAPQPDLELETAASLILPAGLK